MLSSIAHTSETLETSASSQFSASEKLLASKYLPRAIQFLLIKADRHQRRPNRVCVFYAGVLQPLRHGLFGIGLFELLIAGAWQPRIACSSRLCMHSSCVRRFRLAR